MTFRSLDDQRIASAPSRPIDDNAGLSLSEIAYRWGFGDQAQFSRQYRAEFGCTPREARAAARG